MSFHTANSLDVFQGHLLALPGCHGEDVHLQSGQSQRGVVLQLRAEALQHHVVATLRRGEKKTKREAGVT